MQCPLRLNHNDMRSRAARVSRQIDRGAASWAPLGPGSEGEDLGVAAEHARRLQAYRSIQAQAIMVHNRQPRSPARRPVEKLPNL